MSFTFNGPPQTSSPSDAFSGASEFGRTHKQVRTTKDGVAIVVDFIGDISFEQRQKTLQSVLDEKSGIKIPIMAL